MVWTPSEGPSSSTDIACSNVKALQRDGAVIGSVVQGHPDAPATRLAFLEVSPVVDSKGGGPFHGADLRCSSCCV